MRMETQYLQLQYQDLVLLGIIEKLPGWTLICRSIYIDNPVRLPCYSENFENRLLGNH